MPTTSEGASQRHWKLQTNASGIFSAANDGCEGGLGTGDWGLGIGNRVLLSHKCW
ncbi:MAG TPA: hypothetical protein V6D25_26795 [Leptolyngbyaceae cyanobacterium]